MSDIVTYETSDHVAVITLNRPEARNAVNGDVARSLEAAIDQMEDDETIWVGVLCANTEGQERPVFSAGADLKAINSGNAAELVTERGGFGGFAYRDRRKPVIVAVDGLATAGGLEMTLSADLVVASRRSAFGLAEVKRNLIAGAGGLWRLPWAIGRGPALEIILTGKPMTAERAYALGLVTRLVDDGTAKEAALELAHEIAECAPLAVWESLAVVQASDTEDVESLKKLTGEAFGRVIASEDTKEGLTAFIEKRTPQWKGR